MDKLIFVFVRFCWVLILIFSSIILYGQDDSEKDSVSISTFNLDNRDVIQVLEFDNLNSFQNYRPFNMGLPMARSGNLGLPLHYFDSISIQTDFNSILGGYLPYIIAKDKIKFYDTNVPFTSLSYVTGAEKEQQFSAIHTQNFGKRMNVSFQYDRITSEGFYSRQLTSHIKFRGNYRFRSYNNRFESFGYYAISSLETMENGGILISSQDNPDDNTILLDINLRNAQNQLKYRTFGFVNEYSFLKKIDSSSNFSLLFGHELEVNLASRKYSDLISGNGDFYSNNYLDSIQSSDSLSGKEISNSAYFSLKSLGLRLGVKNSRFDYFQNFLVQKDLNSNFLFVDFNKNYGSINIIAKIEKGVSGFHRSENDMFFSLNHNNGSRLTYFGQVVSKTKRPNPLMNSFRLNHYFYNVSLNNQQQNSIKVGFSDTLTSTVISISYVQNKELTYFNEESIISNLNQNINVLRLRIKNCTEFLNNFYTLNQLTFQFTNIDSIIPLPKLVSYSSLYYQNDFFDKTLRLQIGADFYFMSDYRRLNYNPALAQFNTEQNSLYSGSNMQLDVFLNLRIKRAAKIFFKMENLLQPSFSEDSYRIQDYPIPGRALKIGIFWRMLN